MQQPVVTVLMPVYNAAKFLGEAIESILAQTLTNFQFLIIDDASTDNSVDIIRSFTDERITLIQNKKNLGISATLNKGIQLANTELIARMDADDISHAQRLEKQYAYFLTHPDCSLLSCTANTITHDKQFVKVDNYKSPYFFYNLIFECWIYHPSVMYKRSAVLSLGGYQSKYSEDFDLWWHLSRRYKIHHLEEVLLDYRLTDESLCRVTKKNEYHEAQFNQVVRNIHSYTGNYFLLTENEVECLRHNFEPILKDNNLQALIVLLQKLDHINTCIYKKENTNAAISQIKEAAYFKKKFILDNLSKHLSKPDKLWLFLRTGNWQRLYGKKPRTIRAKDFEKAFTQI